MNYVPLAPALIAATPLGFFLPSLLVPLPLLPFSPTPTPAPSLTHIAVALSRWRGTRRRSDGSTAILSSSGLQVAATGGSTTSRAGLGVCGESVEVAVAYTTPKAPLSSPL